MGSMWNHEGSEHMERRAPQKGRQGGGRRDCVFSRHCTGLHQVCHWDLPEASDHLEHHDQGETA